MTLTRMQAIRTKEADMPVIECAGKKIELDDEGYLKRFEDWDEHVAAVLAAREKVGELTRDRMDILKFMRQYYKNYNFFPILRQVCKNIHQPKECVTEKFIEPVEAWKIAGLPNPGEEINLRKQWSVEASGY
ncbi:MAG: TusE/DsrC/DsvC family sulfur relay protein [Actinomycetota bacterium]|nr:TusE/DsrC/DsvC family sulfur relay protein [Actinomycetota bacterium]